MNPWPGTRGLLASPVLETARLRLRLPEERDLDALAAIYADAQTMRYIGEGKVLSRRETWRALAAMMGHWLMRGYGTYMVEVRATGEVVGRIGYYYPEGWPGFELGWILSRAHWGHGYATEGALAAYAHAKSFEPGRVISLIRPANAASMRVAERLGFHAGPETDFMGERIVTYADQLPG